MTVEVIRVETDQPTVWATVDVKIGPTLLFWTEAMAVMACSAMPGIAWPSGNGYVEETVVYSSFEEANVYLR